jgi:hypothetical protein
MNSNFDDLKRAMVDAANTGLQERGAELQQLLDRVAANAAGRPVDEVATDLRSQWQRQGWDPLDDTTANEYAQALAAGNRVVVNVEEIQL